MAIASMWASMATWSTSTVLFCVLNLVIATIFIASNFKSHNHHPQSQLARSPSFLERVKSVNLSSLYYNEVSHDEHQVQYDSTGYNSVSQLNRAPSLLQRVKSIDFSHSFPSFYSAPDDQLLNEHQHESEHSQRDSTSQLTRVPSLLERVKSIKFTTQSVQPSNSTTDTFSSDDQRSDMGQGPHQYPVHDDYVTSLTSEDSGVTPAEKSSTSLTKSSSERRVAESVDDKEDVYRRRPATMRESVVVHDESVDAKADDFIRRFKQQLKLQRLESFQRFRDMLNRGTSSG